MKPELLIEEEKFAEIEDPKERKDIQTETRILYQFYFDIKYNEGSIAKKNIVSNELYIRAFFKLVDYLYQYYQLSDQHFELLKLAADNLLRLYPEKILGLPDGDKKSKSKIFSERLDQVALIFQAGADQVERQDKREEQRLKKMYHDKSVKYSIEADQIRGVDISSFINYLKQHKEKMARLYEQEGEIATKWPRTYSLGKLLQVRAEECRRAASEDAYSLDEDYSPISYESTDDYYYSPFFAVPKDRDESFLEKAPLLSQDMHKRKARSYEPS
jgi:hypothetical protein